MTRSARVAFSCRSFRWLAALALTAGCAGSGVLGPQGPPSPECGQPFCCPAGLRVVAGTDGDDRLRGRKRGDCLVGQGGDDELAGRSGRDELRGGRGDDRLTGGPGADRLRPGPGRDRALGGRGADVFVIGAACEAGNGEIVDGGRGSDRVESPLTRAQLEARGVSFVSVESFETIALLADECADVEKAWGDAPVAAPAGGVFVAVAARPGGGFLAATGGGVFSIGPDGALAPLASGDRAVLDPGGEGFGIRQADTFRVYDASGALLGTLAGLQPFEAFQLFPGSELVFAPRVRVVEESGVVESVRILRPDGSAAADFAAPGLEISRRLPDRLLYTLPSALVARRLDGTELWSAGIGVHKLESAADRTILVPRHVPGRVDHLLGATPAGTAAVDGVVWNLAIAPGGRYSAATTQTDLYVFHDGELTAEVPLPVAYANSLDLSDRGEVLVGGQGPEGEGRILLYHWQGNLLWQEPAATDRNAYRPAVRFAPGGDRFVVVERRGLTAYDILRSPAP